MICSVDIRNIQRRFATLEFSGYGFARKSRIKDLTSVELPIS